MNIDVTPPPAHLNDDNLASAAWSRVQLRAKRLGIWDDNYDVGLEIVASACSRYLRAAREMNSDDAKRAVLENDVAKLRRELRGWLFDWGWVEDPALIPLDDNGLDPDVVAACAPWN